MFWFIALLAGLILIIGGFLTGHWFFGIINGIVVFGILGEGLNYKKKSFIILSILGSVVMIGGSILGIRIEHPFIAGIICLVVNFGLFLYMANKEAAEAAEKQKALETQAAAGDEAAKAELLKLLETKAAAGNETAKAELRKQLETWAAAGDEAAKGKLQKQLETWAAAGDKTAKVELRKQLETRIAAGDEAAKQELIEQGTDCEDYFSYGNTDFDKDALQRVYNLIEAAMNTKGFPWFDMEEMKNLSSGNQYNPFYAYEWNGKTPRGDTVLILYRVGRNQIGVINYKLHLKALPEEAEAIRKKVHEEMQKFLSTISQTNRGVNGYQSSNNYASSDNISNDNISKEKSGMIRVLRGSGGYGDVVYTISGDKVYKGSGGYGDVAYTISGDKVYKGSGGYGDVAYTISGDKVYKGSGGYGDVVYTISGDKVYKGSGGYGDVVCTLDRK